MLKIGEVARRSGLSIDAVRFYERRGVLPPAERTESGYRLFGEDTVARLGLVRQLQALGFTLDEVVDALQSHDGLGATCESERWRLEAVEQRIDERIKELQRTRRNLRTALAACQAGRCRFAESVGGVAGSGPAGATLSAGPSRPGAGRAVARRRPHRVGPVAEEPPDLG